MSSTELVAIHPLDPEDAPIVAATRAMASSTKGVLRGIAARELFDALMESVLPRDDVTFTSDTIGGIPGVWVQPTHCVSTRPSCICTADGSIWGPPRHSAILSRILPQGWERRPLSRTTALRLNIRFRPPSKMLSPATADLMKGVFAGLQSRETPPEVIWHWYSLRSSPAMPSPLRQFLLE
jgi:hypothetical protein